MYWPVSPKSVTKSYFWMPGQLFHSAYQTALRWVSAYYIYIQDATILFIDTLVSVSKSPAWKNNAPRVWQWINLFNWEDQGSFFNTEYFFKFLVKPNPAKFRFPLLIRQLSDRLKFVRGYNNDTAVLCEKTIGTDVLDKWDPELVEFTMSPGPPFY